MEIKLCWYCEHVEHYEGGCGSTWTGCWSGDYSCKCGHFSGAEEHPEITGWPMRANKCPDYILSQKVKDELGIKE